MEWIFNSSFAITMFYGLVLLWIIMKYETAPVFRAQTFSENIFVSVIIPVRNEESTIQSCLAGLAGQDYHVFEIIVVDDGSTDKTADIVNKFKENHPHLQLTLVTILNNPWKKKGALREGIRLAKGELIITRHADTITPSSNWLSTIISFYRKRKPAMIICPVKMQAGYSFHDAFQLTEHLFLQQITASAALARIPFLCNGANLCFSKIHFAEVGGYEGNLEMASGDDIFLLRKFRKGKFKIAYLKTSAASVTTFPLKNWKSSLHQKARWAGKMKQDFYLPSLFTGALLFLTNFLLLICAALSLFLGGPYKTFVTALLIKWIIDFLLLTLSSCHQKTFTWIPWFLFLELFNHIYFILIPVVTLLIKPVWKGRKTE